jgi:hypothetical protein
VNAAIANVRSAMRKKKPGLWENIRKKRASGRPMARKGSKAYKKAVKAGKRINAAERKKRKKRKTRKKK